MMPDLVTGVGGLAAICTTVSYFPQLKKCWETGEAGDLSLGMFLTLMVGLSLWVLYGIFKGEVVVSCANAVSVALLCGILYFKLRDMLRRGKGRATS
jgi:MtN3 and saliva related transmembrane protein